MISLALKNSKVAIEGLEIRKSNIQRLFGPLFDNLNLKHLSISYSKVRKIDENVFLPIKSTLETLNLEGNSLDAFPTNVINNLHNLTKLNLARNGLKSLPNNGLEKLANLQELDLGWNEIDSLGSNVFSGLSNVETLSLNHNELSKFERGLFKPLKKLKSLDIAGNKFREFGRQDFTELSNLWHLNCSHNELTKLPQSIFTRNSQLRVLDLSYNKLKEVDSYLLRGVRFFEGFPGRRQPDKFCGQKSLHIHYSSEEIRFEPQQARGSGPRNA